METAVLEGAFADPPRSSQGVFRAVMNALAEPGTVETLPVSAHPPAPLGEGVGALLLTLADADTPVWLDDRYGDAAARWITFHTDAPMVSARADAAFAVLSEFDLSDFRVGDDAYPDRSATLILLTRFEGAVFTLEGPGIAGTRTVHAALPQTFPETWAGNRALFPRGVDLLLADGARVMGLPRTTSVRAG